MLTDFQKIADGHTKACFNGKEISFHSPTLSDLCDFEDEFGDLEEVFSPKSKKSKIKAMRFLLWLSMRHDEPDLTIKDAGDRFALADMEEDGPAMDVLNSLLPEGAAPKVGGAGQGKPSGGP